MSTSTIRSGTWLFPGNAEKRMICRSATGTFYAAYEYQNPITGNVEVNVSQSFDGGLTWSILFVIGNDAVNTYNRPCMAIDGNNRLHLVYQNWVPGTAQYIIFSNGGLLDLGEIDLGLSVQEPVIAIDSQNRAHIAWTNANILNYKRFDNDIEVLHENPPPVIAGAGITEIGMAIDSQDGVHLLLRAAVAANIGNVYYYYRNLTAGWLPRELLTNNAGAPEFQACGIAIDGDDNPHVVYQEWNVVTGIFYQTKAAGVWQPAETISVVGTLPSIAITTAGIITVAYESNAGVLPVVIRQKLIGDASWGAETNVSGLVNQAGSPILLNANWPEVNGQKSNMTARGFLVIYEFYPPGWPPYNLVFFDAPDLAWPHAPATVRPSVATLPATEVK